jgi:hypothetical protein
MDRLLTMDKDAFLAEMADDVRRILSRVADAVNDAPSGQVINGSEMAVLAAMTELRERAFEKAVQMRVDSTESAFSPAGRRVAVGRGDAEQGSWVADGAERQRADPGQPDAVLRRRRG